MTRENHFGTFFFFLFIFLFFLFFFLIEGKKQWGCHGY